MIIIIIIIIKIHRDCNCIVAFKKKNMRWREKPITATERMKNESTDSVPDTKSAEQSDGNIWRSNSFKKKGKGYRCTAESIFIYSKILWLWKAGIRGRHQ